MGYLCSMQCSQPLLISLLASPGCGRGRILKLFHLLSQKQLSPEDFWQKPENVFSLRGQFYGLEEMLGGIQQFKKRWSVEGYWQYVESKGITVLTADDQAYPALLKQIPDYPLALFMKGNGLCLQQAGIAVVGSRRPTRYGQWVTQKLTADLAAYKTVIISGFMAGIDYQAHSAAVQCGLPSVGVLGFGFGQFYPAHLRRAADEFLSSGKLFVTEYPPNNPPTPGQFPARNRIVAGLSLATIVVEARQKSGSLITAQCALDYNRVVGAVPGPIDSALSCGTHYLIREGAVLVQSGKDVWNELYPSAVKS